MSDLRNEPKVSLAHGEGCPCCTGQAALMVDFRSGKVGTGSDVKAGQDKLESEAQQNPLFVDWMREKIFGGKAVEYDRAAADPKTQLEKKFEVEVKDENGKFSYSFRADGVSHELFKTEASENGLKEAGDRLKSLANEKMSQLTQEYKVTFAREGEEVTKAKKDDGKCGFVEAEMLYAKTPTLRQLYAIEEGVRQSQPSQLVSNSDQGIKIYFVDGRPYPQVYGGRWPLGIQINKDKDDKRAFYVTSDGAKMPMTDKDVAEGGDKTRNLKWIVAHELTHNGQANLWDSRLIPEDIINKLGWTVDNIEKDGKVVLQLHFSIAGKSGDHYTQYKENCNGPSAWYRTTSDGTPLNGQGQKAENVSGLRHYSNDEVGADALVKPNTYYFMNPREMLSEGLTSFRYDQNYRQKLLSQSPRLYQAAKEFDNQELAKFYGADSTGLPKVLRLPSGKIVARNAQSEAEVLNFERR